MKFLKILPLFFLLWATNYPRSAQGENNNYLLINLTSYTTAESRKAIEYAKAELQKGRPVIIYLDNGSVRVAARTNSQQFKEQQQNLVELMQKGAIVAACPYCLKRYGISEAHLLPGIQIAQVHYE